jgi:thioredoxin-like negative regulator of GroEL
MRLSITSVFTLLLMACPTVYGQASGSYDQQGKTAFEAGQYQAAADLFKTQITNNPQDATAHYYLGLCYHCLNRIPQASREYNWVLYNSQDPELLQRVQLGLQSMAKLPGSTNVPPQWESMPPTATPVNHPRLAALPSTQGGNGPLIGPSGQYRMVDCYTSWCTWCKKFEPLLHRAESDYQGRIEFERVDAEAPGCAQFVKTYRIQAYPTLLFFDPEGHLVKRIDGAPQKYEDFRRQIAKAFPGLH